MPDTSSPTYKAAAARLILIGLLMLPVAAARADWPTYMQNPARSGACDETLAMPLQLQWVHQSRPPEPSWPGPAHHDYYHNRRNLKPMVTFDVVDQIVASRGRVLFGSSAEGKVYCLDAADGKIVWTFATEGPVRLAPTVEGDSVIFGSDDGCVYSVAFADGRLKWKTRLTDRDRRIGGTGRITSAWPVRAGGLVQGGKAYFCAGIFPMYGAYYCCLDVQTGKLLASKKIDDSAQGYLHNGGGAAQAQTGAVPKMAVLGPLGAAPKAGGLIFNSIIARKYRCGLIACKNIHVAGGDGEVAAFVPPDYNKGEPRIVWEAKVEGRAYGLAIDSGRLLVSTDAGKVYCFGAGKAQAGLRTNAKPQAVEARFAELGAKILKIADIDRGYALVTDARDGKLACAIAGGSQFQVVCWTTTDEASAAVQKTVDEAGLSHRVSVHRAPAEGKTLPYSDYLFNVIVHEGLLQGKALEANREELNRVLRPCGGVAMLGKSLDEVIRRGALKGGGTWSHSYADPGNSTCSGDELVSGPLALQWFGAPGPREMVDRHNRGAAPVWANGVLYVSGYDYLYCLDAYNGTLRWQKPLPASARMDATRDSGNMAARDDVLYVSAGGQCLALDARSGEVRRTFDAAADGAKCEWGYVASVDDMLIGSASRSGAHRRVQDQNSWHWAYDGGRPLVTSTNLFAFDRSSGKRAWTYTPPSGAIVNAAIAIDGGRVFFVESTNPASSQAPDSKSTLEVLVGKGSQLVALDLRSGRELFRMPAGLETVEHMLYLSVSRGVAVACGSRTEKVGDKGAILRHDLYAFEAATGKAMWKAVHTAAGAEGVGASHGENAFRPSIVGDVVYINPGAYDLRTGKALPIQWGQEKRGCGAYAMSATGAYFRLFNPAVADLKTGQTQRLTSVTRPGCWINIIPAGGLVLIPEGSSGCTCPYQVQTSLGLIPVK